MNSERQAFESYYAARAHEYEAIYAKPERQADLRQLEAELPTWVAGRRLIEIACGTAYWTQFLAPAARETLALDINDSTLEVARAKPWGEPAPRFATGDAFALPAELGPFDAAFAGFWWSHLRVQDQARFLASLDACLAPGARVILLDNRYVEGSSTPISRRDEAGNTWQTRKLADGSTHDVLKNFPGEAELLAATRDWGRALAWRQLEYYWVFVFEKSPR